MHYSSVWKRQKSSNVTEKIEKFYIFLEFDCTRFSFFPLFLPTIPFQSFWFLSCFSRFALPVIPDSCSGDKHSYGLFLSPVLERMSFLQHQCASLHRSLNQWRILIISHSTNAAHDDRSLWNMPDFPDSCSFIGTVTSKMSNFPSTSSHRPVVESFFARSFCLELSLDTHVILSLLKASGVHLFHGEGSYCPCHYSLK